MPDPIAKIHPATREMLADDPLQMTGFEIPGDPDLMLRLLVEEYARMGWNASAIMSLARDPDYQAFRGLMALYGEQALQRRITEVISRCGVMRVTATEREPTSEQLVQLHLPTR